MTRMSKIYAVSSMLAALALSANTASAGSVTVHTPTPVTPKVNVHPATGGAGAGKIKFNEFTIKKTTTSASSKLYKNAATGTHYKKTTIVTRKAGGDAPDWKTDGTADAKPTFLKFEFKNVAPVSSFDSGSAPPPPPPPPPPN